MKGRRILKRTAITPVSLLLGVIGFFFLVSASVTLTLNFRPLYYLDMKLLDIPGTSGYPEELIRENYDRLISYNNITSRGELNFEQMPMSDQARIHFKEVKQVFGFFEYLAIGSGLLLAAGIAALHKKRDFGWMKAAAYCSIGIPAVLGIFVLSDWETVFVEFHRLVFRNDYWLFDPVSDPVIRILPDTYFLHCAAMILLLMIGASLGFLFLYRRKVKKCTK